VGIVDPKTCRSKVFANRRIIFVAPLLEGNHCKPTDFVCAANVSTDEIHLNGTGGCNLCSRQRREFNNKTFSSVEGAKESVVLKHVGSIFRSHDVEHSQLKRISLLESVSDWRNVTGPPRTNVENLNCSGHERTRSRWIGTAGNRNRKVSRKAVSSVVVDVETTRISGYQGLKDNNIARIQYIARKARWVSISSVTIAPNLGGGGHSTRAARICVKSIFPVIIINRCGIGCDGNGNEGSDRRNSLILDSLERSEEQSLG